MILDNMLRAVALHLPKMHNHQFNLGLHNNTLPCEIFAKFLEQDIIYLREYALAIKKLASRLEQPDHRRLFEQIHTQVLLEQRNLKHNYLPNIQISGSFFVADRSINMTMPVVANYIAYLQMQVKTAHVASAVASLLPCFYIYSELGRSTNQNEIQANNRYYKWLASYSNADFLLTTKSFINVMNELSFGLSRYQKKSMVCAFVESTNFEIAFWDSVVSECYFEKNLQQTFPSKIG